MIKYSLVPKICATQHTEIIKRNQQNKLKTPQPHKCPENNRGRNRKTTTRYNLLSDGCHLTSKIAKALAKCLTKTIALNKHHINLDKKAASKGVTTMIESKSMPKVIIHNAEPTIVPLFELYMTRLCQTSQFSRKPLAIRASGEICFSK